jgi:hypothetical protein
VTFLASIANFLANFLVNFLVNILASFRRGPGGPTRSCPLRGHEQKIDSNRGGGLYGA